MSTSSTASLAHTLHVTDPLILSGHFRTSVTLIGVGGTGSHLLQGLADIHQAMVQLGGRGLFVTAWDMDHVEPHNIGRQAFDWTDLYANKAERLIARLNRAYGLDWKASSKPFKIDWKNTPGYISNIVITAVDSGAFRNKFHTWFRSGLGVQAVRGVTDQQHRDFGATRYWLDTGNGKDFGQVVLGAESLKDAVEVCGTFDERMDEETCSTAESLGRQDLFINRLVADHAVDLLWGLFRRGQTAHNVVYINLKNRRTRATLQPRT